MSHHKRALCVVLLAIVVSACACGASPTTPSVTSGPPVPSVLPVPVGQPAAVLVVSTFTVTRSAAQPYSDWVLYDVKLRLSETSGKSRATLKAVGLFVPVVGTDFGCTQSQQVRINPGQTWDMDSLGYCAPEVSIHKSVGTEVASVSLSVTFADDDGRTGSLSSTVTTN